MSVRQLNIFFDDNIDFEAIMETLNKAYKGKNDISLSNFENDLEPVVKIGSVFDNNGSIFLVEGTDETPVDYGTISSSTTFYLYWDATNDEFMYSEDVPVWSDALQGWYNGNNRAFFSIFKDSGDTLYQGKRFLTHINDTFVGVEVGLTHRDLVIYDSDVNETFAITTLSKLVSFGWDGDYVIPASGKIRVQITVNTTSSAANATLQTRINNDVVDTWSIPVDGGNPTRDLTISVEEYDHLMLYASRVNSVGVNLSQINITGGSKNDRTQIMLLGMSNTI